MQSIPITATTVIIRRRRFSPYRKIASDGTDADRACRSDDTAGAGSFSSSSSSSYVAHFDEARWGESAGDTAVTDVEDEYDSEDMPKSGDVEGTYEQASCDK